jgi:hypothetical protein
MSYKTPQKILINGVDMKSLCMFILLQINAAEAGSSGRAVYGAGLRSLSCCDSGFESHRQHECLCVMCVVCCQIEVSATS